MNVAGAVTRRQLQETRAKHMHTSSEVPLPTTESFSVVILLYDCSVLPHPRHIPLYNHQPNIASPALQQVAHVRWLQLGNVTAAAARRS